MHQISQILQQVERGDAAAAERLLPLVYDELRLLAAQRLEREQPGQTLQATALVHEAWLRLVDVQYDQPWSNRRHFFGAAAEAMRRILVDRARRRNRQKHGADWRQITIQMDEVPVAGGDSLLESVDEALERLEQVDAAAGELVKLRYFAGLSLREAGETLELAPRTADRLWAYAKAWLKREIQLDSTDSS
ncbi:MAG: sigma-70 family RNA polymerase sigma factor [Planctomycetaceae bacterium]|nr:sigma-70 family RNA polymerase sigma factor [Planctomycetaceae bacterium]